MLVATPAQPVVWERGELTGPAYGRAQTVEPEVVYQVVGVHAGKVLTAAVGGVLDVLVHHAGKIHAVGRGNLGGAYDAVGKTIRELLVGGYHHLIVGIAGDKCVLAQHVDQRAGHGKRSTAVAVKGVELGDGTLVDTDVAPRYGHTLAQGVGYLAVFQDGLALFVGRPYTLLLCTVELMSDSLRRVTSAESATIPSNAPCRSV